MRRALILLVFLLSGAAGLIYQVAWMRQLTLVLGVTSQAVSTVLAAFMGGLALGSWLLGRAGDESRSPLRVYGWLELGIALFGAQSLLLLDGLPELYAETQRTGLFLGWEWLPVPGGALPALRVALAAAVLIGPTTLMGATLPILIRGVCRTRERVARESGLLYGVNTAGAVLGTLFAAFWLIESVGVRASILFAAGVNLAVGVVSLAVARREDRRREDEGEEDELALEADEDAADDGDEEEDPEARRTAGAVLLAFGVSGFLALAYEVLWTRYLVYVVGENSVYAFATMLAAFLIGIALGSFLAALAADAVRDLAALLGCVLVLVGASAVATVSLMPLLAGVEAPPGADSFWEESGFKLLQCLGVLLVPTTLSGTTFAIVARVYARRPGRLGRDAGRAYAVNTLGAILGALAGGFLVLPQLGLTVGLVALSAVGVLAGYALLLLPRREGRPVAASVLVGLVAAAAFLSLRWVGDPRDLVRRGEAEELEFYADGPESSVAVLRDRDTGDLHLVVNGDGQAGTDPLMQIHLRLLGHLPAALHPDPRTGLVVAFGAGVTTGSLAQHPLERVDLVEISREVIEASPLFAPYNHDPLPYVREGEEHRRADAKVQLTYGDGRNFLLATEERYDVITSDPIDPDDAGVTSLYCKEYYELVRERLKDGGVACQWMSTRYAPADYKMLVRTFQEVFPSTSIWFAEFTTVLVGFKDEPRATLDDLRRRFEVPEVAASLDVVGVEAPEDLLSLLLLPPEGVRGYVGDGPLNTDDRPRIEYRGPRGDLGGIGEATLHELLEARDPGPAAAGGVLAAWSDADAAACAPAFESMALLCRRYLLELGAHARPRGGERAAGVLERALEDEARAAEFLALTWELLASDAPRIHRMMAGIARAEPAPRATEEERERYERGLREGLDAWRAGELGRAQAAFAAAAEAPGAWRPAVLAAACLQRQGRPLEALESLLWIDFLGLGEWSVVRRFAHRMMERVLAAMDENPAGAEAMGRTLLLLTPRDAARPDEPRGPRSWRVEREDEPRPPRPVDAPGDVDAWRLWWLDARAELVAHSGAFVWDWGV